MVNEAETSLSSLSYLEKKAVKQVIPIKGYEHYDRLDTGNYVNVSQGLEENRQYCCTHEVGFYFVFSCCMSQAHKV